ncbi:hypothetical protein HMPREF1980_00798 [Actinomyces sp. oral taxon 172 str. F0311]|nr:hypothetical protein HMPREF1980_00798 [Actinomyces sp. oral taxon 172 str. F0311]
MSGPTLAKWAPPRRATRASRVGYHGPDAHGRGRGTRVVTPARSVAR